MKFVMNRDHIVASVLGHAVEFKKGVPTHVPKELWKEVQTHGAVPEDEIPEAERPVASNEPTDPAEREAALHEVFSTLVLGNVRENFTAGGQPHLAVLAKELGWTVHAKERDAAWVTFQADKD